MFRAGLQGQGSLQVTCFPVLSVIFLLSFAATQGLAEAKFDLSLITEKTRRYTYVNSFYSEKFGPTSNVGCPKEVVFDPKDVVKVDESTLTYSAGAISINSAGNPCTQAKRLTLWNYTGGSSSLPDSDVQIYSSHLTPDALGRVSAMLASPAALMLSCPVTLASDVIFARNGRQVGPTRVIGPFSFIVSPSTTRIANGLVLKANTLHLFTSCPECTACDTIFAPTDCSCLYEGGSVASSSSSAGKVTSGDLGDDNDDGNSEEPSSGTPGNSEADGGASMWVWLGPVLGAFATVLAGSFVFCAVRSQGQAPQPGAA